MDLSLARPLFALNKRELMARAKSSSSGVSVWTLTIGSGVTHDLLRWAAWCEVSHASGPSFELMVLI
jgi:hypothetical protein